jgi:hypothetical protein
MKETLASALAIAGLALVATILSGEVAAARADTAQLSPRFAIDGQTEFTRSTEATIGDGGWSPFFEPGVVVWDGGSIVGGYGAAPGMEYPTQSIRLVPHPVSNVVSWSPVAKLADMLDQAPVEVDARYRVDADANVCVVMAGAADIVAGREPTMIHDDLRLYCLARRAAGFRVVMVTLLPRSEPAHFEAGRQVVNELVRQNWSLYADGLADIAEDGRIGDAFDDLDLAYYAPGALHPNDAGYSVMAVVTAPVLNQMPWRSSDCQMRFRNADGASTAWLPYSSRFSWQLEAGDGLKTVFAEYRNGTGTTVAVSDTIGLDTVAPITRAPYRVSAKRGYDAILKYAVKDADPCGPKAGTVTIRVKDSARRVVKTLAFTGRPVNRLLGARLAVPRTWRPGTYTFYVFATDNAGNRQSLVGRNVLTVRP